MEETATNLDQTLPADFRSRGLKLVGAGVLRAALLRSRISTREIAYFIPKEIERNRERFTQTIGWLGLILKSRGVQLVPDKDGQAYREQYPIAESSKKRKFRKIENNTELPGRYKEPTNLLEQLEEEGSQYEYDILGKYYAEIRQFLLLTQEEESELGRRAFEDSDLDARNKLVEHNLRLVRWIARRYVWSNIEFEDLLQEGNVGLMIAAEKYDYRRGRFTTYAVWWIRATISRAIMDQSRTVRLPVHVQELDYKIREASHRIAGEVGRIPTTAEIARAVELPVEKVSRALIRMRTETIVSLDDTINMDGHRGRDDDELTIGESIPDNQTINHELYIEACQELKTAQQRVNSTLQEITGGLLLSERNIGVFRTFYGFDGSGQRRTLEATGQQFKVSRERVRQIITSIWRKVDDRGGDMDHDHLLEELVRIEKLEKIVASVTS